MKNTEKTDMQEALRNLLLKDFANTQEQICGYLAKKGFDVNQSKISRLLRKIGAVKTKNEFNQVVYRLSKEPLPPSTDTLLSNLIIEVTHNETLIVISTSPGSASLIARLLDYNREKTHILGTVAGDDTIIVIPKSIKKILSTLQEVKNLLLEQSETL